MIPTHATRSTESLALSESEQLFLSKAKKSRKSKLIAESSEAVLEGKPLDPVVLSQVVDLLAQTKPESTEHLAAAILCRLLPRGSAAAESACKLLSDNFGRLRGQES